MINPGMMTSASDNWATPLQFFQTVVYEFGVFDLDVCADANNAKADKFFDHKANGLDQEWTGLCWMNPPYGTKIGLWVRKAAESARGGGDSRVPAPSPNRYRLVARQHRGEGRGQVHSRAPQIRRREIQRAIPVVPGCI